MSLGGDDRMTAADAEVEDEPEARNRTARDAGVAASEPSDRIDGDVAADDNQAGTAESARSNSAKAASAAPRTSSRRQPKGTPSGTRKKSLTDVLAGIDAGSRKARGRPADAAAAEGEQDVPLPSMSRPRRSNKKATVGAVFLEELIANSSYPKAENPLAGDGVFAAFFCVKYWTAHEITRAYQATAACGRVYLLRPLLVVQILLERPRSLRRRMRRLNRTLQARQPLLTRRRARARRLARPEAISILTTNQAGAAKAARIIMATTCGRRPAPQRHMRAATAPRRQARSRCPRNASRPVRRRSTRMT
jgi:hypothetical protein